MLVMHNADFVYHWAVLHGAEKIDKIEVDKIATNFSGIYAYVPKGMKPKIIEVSQNIFPNKVLTPTEIIIGAICADKTKDFEVKLNIRGINCQSLTLLELLDREKISKFPNLTINGHAFKYKEFLVDTEQQINMYLREYFSSIIDVYLMHILFKNHYLLPLLFTNFNLSDVVEGDNLTVPIELYWLFKLKYGKLYNIRSMIRLNPSYQASEFSHNTVRFRMRRKKQIACVDKGIDIKIRWKSASPVVISGFFPMRFL
jgi:hypothetical protein